MIELLLQAERALGTGAYDVAERLYWQAIDADSQNAIAIVGLAKVARLKGDDRTAIAFGRRALKVDSENAVARKLVAELEAAHPEGVRPAPAPETPSGDPASAAAVTTALAAAPAPETKAPEIAAPEPPARGPAVAASEPPPADPVAEAAATPPAGGLPADPGVRLPRGGRPDLDWPAADLQQVRPPRDK